jgi:ATP-dependent protease HslVU (ClpYQ) ATPase subunit
MMESEAFDYLVDEEEQKLIDMDQVQRVAIEPIWSVCELGDDILCA